MQKCRNLNKVLIGALMLVVLIGAILLLTIQDTKAYAAGEISTYGVTFDYQLDEVSKKDRVHIENKSNVAGANIPEHDSSYYYNTSLKLTTQKNHLKDDVVVNSSHFLNGRDVTLEVNTNYSYVLINLIDSNGKLVEYKEDRVFTIHNLKDSRYTFQILLKGSKWKKSVLKEVWYEAVLEATVNIDNSAPTLSGASTDPNCEYDNKGTNVVATDNMSGIHKMTCLDPEGKLLEINGVKYAIPKFATNGVYEFNLVDNAGNKSSPYYYRLDNESPTIEFNRPNGDLIEKEIINESFCVKGQDTLSGVYKLEVKRPNKDIYEGYNMGEIISSTSLNGEYSFRVYDKAGNYIEKSIILDTSKPKGIIYAGSESIKSGSSTNKEYIKFVATDGGTNKIKAFVKYGNLDYEPYNPGDILTSPGTYTFYVMDMAGNVSEEYMVTIDRVAPVLNATVDFGKTTGLAFTVNAEKMGGEAILFVKEPLSTSFEAAPSLSYSVDINSPVGKYYFYAEDTLGNSTEEKWVSYQGGIPEAQIIKDSTNNTAKVVWDDESWVATLNGQPYENGTIIDVEGQYKLVLSATNGKSKTYNFSINHQYVLFRVVNPTCQEEGFKEYKCKSCGKTFQAEKTPRIDHNYVEQVTKPTCTSKGYKKRVCTMCGKAEIIEEYEMLEHVYEETVIMATCERNGCHRHTCKYCGSFFDTDIVEAYGHSYESTVIKEATCTEDGIRHFKCKTCGHEYDQVIKAKGHSYRIESEVDNGESTIRTYICGECGHRYTQDLGNQHQKIADYMEKIFDNYEPYMWWVLLATSGVWSIALGVMLILAHREEDKHKFKRRLVNYIIGLVVIAIILVACPYLIKGIAIAIK